MQIKGLMMGSIGLRLRAEREERGLTQQKFAELGGVKKLTQIQYEADKTAPDANYLVKMSALGLDVTYVITGQRLDPLTLQQITETSKVVNQIEPVGGALSEKALVMLESAGPDAALREQLTGAARSLGAQDLRLLIELAVRLVKGRATA